MDGVRVNNCVFALKIRIEKGFSKNEVLNLCFTIFGG